jgi:hypothetical protein
MQPRAFLAAMRFSLSARPVVVMLAQNVATGSVTREANSGASFQRFSCESLTPARLAIS